MEKLSYYLAVDLLGLQGWYRDIVYAVLILVAAVVVFAIALVFAGLLTWLERRVAGRMQSRIGPNRVGPFGLLQWLADGLKLFLKEDFIPGKADKPLFLLAVYPVMIGVFAAFATIPFGQLLIAADLNIGILYLIAITSLVVVGILMAGWSSNNKWSLLGGIRSAAQIVAYEVPSAMAMLSVVMLSGTLSLQGIIQAQGGWPWEWYLFYNPFSFVAFFLYFTAAVAEGNRTPFDLPEAESELVSGYNTEYSGFRFAGFFLAEFANIYLMSSIATALFFGGWQIPMVTPEQQANSVILQLIGAFIFVAKAWAGCFLVVWLRWTLPRLRVDQLSMLCYKYLLPLAFVCLLGNAVYIWIIKAGSPIDKLVHLGMTGFGGLLVAVFFWRVFHHIFHVGDKFDFDVLARGSYKAAFDPTIQKRRYGRFRKRRHGEAC
jgi:NADH-quinone oxidoreductase subunit H